MKITGKDIIDAVARRLAEEDIRCYDSAIVQRLSELGPYETAQLTALGDVLAWHNERINSANVRDHGQPQDWPAPFELQAALGHEETEEDFIRQVEETHLDAEPKAAMATPKPDKNA
jgi:hypothetical protein